MKTLFFNILAVLVFTVTQVLAQESLELISYYPSPKGAYKIASFGEVVAVSGTSSNHFMTISYDSVGSRHLICPTLSTDGSGLALDKIVWSTDGGVTSNLTIDKNGSIGVGTGFPDTNFVVSNYGETPTQIKIKNAGGTEASPASPAKDSSIFDITFSAFKSDESKYYDISRIYSYIPSLMGETRYAGNMTFQTKDVSGDLQDRMTIRSNGVVGIGTTNPDQAFFEVYEPKGVALNTMNLTGPVSTLNLRSHYQNDDGTIEPLSNGSYVGRICFSGFYAPGLGGDLSYQTGAYIAAQACGDWEGAYRADLSLGVNYATMKTAFAPSIMISGINGNVGIGNTNKFYDEDTYAYPRATLHVRQDSDGFSGIRIENKNLGSAEARCGVEFYDSVGYGGTITQHDYEDGYSGGKFCVSITRDESLLSIGNSGDNSAVSIGASGSNSCIFLDTFNSEGYIDFRNDGISWMTLAGGKLGVGRTAGTNRLEVQGDASKTTPGPWIANSDARIKTNVFNISNAIETIMKLRPVGYHYTEAYMEQHSSIKDKVYYNFIAQEYRDVFPDDVKGSGEYLDDSKDPCQEILQIDTNAAQIYSIKAIQEQQEIIEEQRREINSLKEEVQELRQLKNDFEKLRKEISWKK